MIDELPIEVTPKQNRYLQHIDGSPKTSRDLRLSLDVPSYSVLAMIAKLRNIGLVRSSRVLHSLGNIWQHELVTGYDKLVESGMMVVSVPYHHASEKELQYVADLRKKGLIGQRLIAKHIERFPDRDSGSVRHLVNTARSRGMF